jgi:hypothetical protein
MILEYNETKTYINSDILYEDILKILNNIDSKEIDILFNFKESERKLIFKIREEYKVNEICKIPQNFNESYNFFFTIYKK